jgi:hypothetical protein
MRNLLLASAVLLALAGQEARAGTIDLTTAGNSGFDAGGIGFFQQINAQPTGTGVIDSFVRLQTPNGMTDFERGYNTSARPVQFDEKTDLTFTHDLNLSDIPTATGATGIVYRVFLLDINQTGSNSLLNLNELQIFQSNTADLTGAMGEDAQGVGRVSFASANLIYDLQGLNRSQTLETILMDASLNSGSGSGDMLAFIPDSLFDPSQQFVTLYSQFGTPPGPNFANDGFEEWAVDHGVMFPTPPPFGGLVPAPPSVILLATGALGMFVRLRRRGLRVA